MSWMSKFDALIPSLKESALAHWDVAAVFGVVAMILAYIIAVRHPERRLEMRGKMRQFRYCHDCKWNDSVSEECAINADRNERCGLIDTQAGLDYDVTQN